MPEQPKIYVVVYENPDSTTGADFTGIFDNKREADSWAESEGMGAMVFETTFGPIDWKKIDPSPKVDWDEAPSLSDGIERDNI